LPCHLQQGAHAVVAILERHPPQRVETEERVEDVANIDVVDPAVDDDAGHLRRIARKAGQLFDDGGRADRNFAVNRSGRDGVADADDRARVREQMLGQRGIGLPQRLRDEMRELVLGSQALPPRHRVAERHEISHAGDSE
jgi:hypothetical protein